ncbi:hypothetical protein BKA81DRAFT_233755 [Phyllosticta paracitricarpa]
MTTPHSTKTHWGFNSSNPITPYKLCLRVTSLIGCSDMSSRLGFLQTKSASSEVIQGAATGHKDHHTRPAIANTDQTRPDKHIPSVHPGGSSANLVASVRHAKKKTKTSASGPLFPQIDDPPQHYHENKKQESGIEPNAGVEPAALRFPCLLLSFEELAN